MQEFPQETLTRLSREGRIQSLAVSETGFAFDPRNGQSFTLNHTGVAALEQFRQGKSLPETAAVLAQAYALTGERVETSLDSFVRQLGRYLR